MLITIAILSVRCVLDIPRTYLFLNIIIIIPVINFAEDILKNYHWVT